MILCLAVASCIQDEAQNVEAAIDGCSGNHIQQYLIDRNDFTIQLYVSKAADPSKTNINFDLPTGASIKPVRQLTGDEANVYNFNDENPREFKVTSEDGAFFCDLYNQTLADRNAFSIRFRDAKFRCSLSQIL